MPPLIRPVRRRLWAAFLTTGMLVAAGLAACAPAAAPPPTATLPPPTATAVPSLATAAPPTQAPTATAPPPTLTATPTPTAQAVGQPTLGYYNITPRADATLVTPFPTPVAALPLDANLVNILLIGTDSRPYLEKNFRTDTLIIVSINKQTGQVALVSIPRDLFVYVPTWGMTRINTAYDAGQRVNYPGGGPAMLEQTLLYNLGVPIHYYAAINFAGFRQVVDTLDGIEVAVTCPLTEYKLRSPELDETQPDNYDLYTQPVGLAHLDGDVALWYARARPVGGDYFRSYRQRQVLRAIFHRALALNVIPQIPALYADFQEVVTTNMGLWDLMQFAPLAGALQDTQIRSYAIGPNQTTRWLTPKGDDVLLPQPGPLTALLQEAFQPAAKTTQPEAQPAVPVEIVNASGQAGLELLAAETLRNDGFAPVLGAADAAPQAATALLDFTLDPKTSPLKQLQALLHVSDKHVTAQPDTASAVAFRVTLGEDYNPCPRLDWLPATPTPAPTP